MKNDIDDIDTVEDHISSHLVFQCLKCNLIIGDSISFHGANKDQDTITLSLASNIKRTGELFTSKSGFDVGSTYFSLCCTGCNVSIIAELCELILDVANYRQVLLDDFERFG